VVSAPATKVFDDHFLTAAARCIHAVSVAMEVRLVPSYYLAQRSTFCNKALRVHTIGNTMLLKLCGPFLSETPLPMT